MSDPSTSLYLDQGPVPPAVARVYLWLVAGLAGLGLALLVVLAVGTQAARDAERVVSGTGYASVLVGALAARRAHPAR